jgi:sugar/nucleoside kinase (ribokinase family)
MKRYHVYGIGNALVDMEFEVTPSFLSEMGIEKGLMTLVDESRQIKLIESMHGIQHKRSCGGSAANTLIAVAQLGGKSFYSCKVASDEIGDFYVGDLEETGVATNLKHQRESGHTGRCMVFITPDADRTMNTFLGVSANLSREELMPDALKDSEYLYIEGYLLASPKGREAARMARDIAREAGVKTSLTFSDPGIATHFRSEFLDLIAPGLDLLFCNEAEALAFTKKTDFEGAAQTLKSYAKAFVITRGARGAYIFDGTHEIHVVAPKVDPVDTIGAGDIFAGSLLYGITNGYSYGDAARLACGAASKLVTQFGARLELDQIQSLRRDLLK